MEENNNRQDRQPLIDLQHISRVYQVGVEQVFALRDINLKIYKNEYVAIMGPSGSGKSTLMNIIGCLDTPTGGAYYLKGINVGELDDDELAEIRNKEIGFVFQMFNLLPRASALKNVELPLIYAGVPKHIRLERAMNALNAVGMGDRINYKPNELSGGQKQKVAIARVLVTNPSIILADEPTGDLDSKSGEDIMRIFHKLWLEGNTIVLVTHERDIALHAQRIVRLRDGLIESDEMNHHRVVFEGVNE
jgi:putative ABC transport system ATP-binding protein